MGLFFDTGKYLTRVESPRIDATKDRREQINDYIVKYFEMYPHDYTQKAFKLYCTMMSKTFEAYKRLLHM